jgi:hypothetical protein
VNSARGERRQDMLSLSLSHTHTPPLSLSPSLSLSITAPASHTLMILAWLGGSNLVVWMLQQGCMTLTDIRDWSSSPALE